MARIDNATIERWRDTAGAWINANVNPIGKLGLGDVCTGRDAWTVAHRCGITNEAYTMSRGIVDAHIQTALEKIFPNAVFKDAKRY